MKIAYILFDDITLLDFVGIYDPLSRIRLKNMLPDFQWDLCSHQAMIEDGYGLKMKMDKVRPDLSTYDMLIVPGGFGTRELMKDAEYLEWLRTAAPVPYKVSVCTGSLLLGAAGFLEGKSATTHFNEYETLKPFCKTVVPDRIVVDGKTITAGAVASSLDLGLYLCSLLVGGAKTEEIRVMMNYRSGFATNDNK
ncbi:MAG: DJ-1/PfpI family protein [Bacteroidota bacterium]